MASRGALQVERTWKRQRSFHLERIPIIGKSYYERAGSVRTQAEKGPLGPFSTKLADLFLFPFSGSHGGGVCCFYSLMQAFIVPNSLGVCMVASRTTIHASLPGELIAQVRVAAKENGVSVGTLVRIALARLIKEEPMFAPVRRLNGNGEWESIPYDDREAVGSLPKRTGGTPEDKNRRRLARRDG